MNNNLPLVCVLMPVFNGETTIKLALDSLVKQSYQNWICLIVNDGSTDGTPEIIERYSKNDNRFNIVNLAKNQGRGNARQVALEHATGDLLTYLDADDFFHPDKINNQVQVMINHPEIHLVSCAIGSFDSFYALKVVRGFKYSGSFHFLFKDNPRFIPVTSMIRLKEAQTFKYNNKLDGPEDTDYLTRYIDDKKYYILNDLLYYYREFESVSYLKIIYYRINGLKAILSVRHKYGMHKFIKKFTLTLGKTIFFIISYPIIGKRLFLNKRGQFPKEAEILKFNHVLKQLG